MRLRPKAGLLLIAGVVCICCTHQTGSEGNMPSEEARPGALPSLGELDTAGKNLIVVLSDTHRADHVSPFSSNPAQITPNVEVLARDGVAFTRAYTPVPISAPAYATLMTGTLPPQHGVLNNQQALHSQLPLLQEKLSEAGYITGAVVSNPFCSAAKGFARGFDYFWDAVTERGKGGEVVSEVAIDWLTHRPPDRPFFLFLAYMDAHTPFLSPEIPPSLLVKINGESCCRLQAERAHIPNRIPIRLAPGRNTVALHFLEDGRPAVPADSAGPLVAAAPQLEDRRLEWRLLQGWRMAQGESFYRLDNEAVIEVHNGTGEKIDTHLLLRCTRRYREHEWRPYYLAGVRAFDRHLGRLLQFLRQRGLYRDAVIVFLSDHGEMLGEHGVWGHVSHLYEETLRVPLIVKAPGLVAGARYERRYLLQDLHSLLLTLATHSSPLVETFPFVDHDQDAPLVAATYPPESSERLVAVVRQGMKLISDGGERFELFDLAEQPLEARNLYGERRDDATVGEMLARVHSELRAVNPSDFLDLDALTPEDIDRLRALGYLGDRTPGSGR